MEIQNFLKFDELNNIDLPALMKQYQEFKLKYFDFIVFFRVGSFYETYFDDAHIFSRLTGATLTRRRLKTGNIHMAGVSHKNINSYVKILLQNHYKVVIVDETNEKTEDNVLKRKVTKIYTNGCLYETEYLNPQENNYLASVYREEDVYKIAYTDISVGGIFVSEGSFNEIKCELSRINPVELIIPFDIEIEFELYESYEYEKLRKEFYEGGNENKAYVGLINYLKFILGDYSPKLEKLKKYDIRKLLSIDFLTRKNLELIKNAYNNKIEGSLLWAVNNCKTPMGRRLLSSIISSPLNDIDEIKKRQELILKINEYKQEVLNLSSLFESIGDISRLTSKMSNKTLTPIEFLTLKNGLEPVKEIFKLQKKLKPYLNSQNDDEEKILRDYYYILDKTFEDDIEKIKAGKYIKKGANSELDVLNSYYDELLAELKAYEEHLREETKIKSLKINQKAGSYYIEINSNSQNAVMADFAIIQKLKTSIKYTTLKLLSYEEKILSLEGKIKDLRKEIFENLKKYSIEMIEYIRNYSKNIAIFDVCLSLIILCQKTELSFPKINNEGRFEIKGLRHLAAEKILNKFEPLDISLQNSNLIFLTGINGVGKSTLLKAIGNLIVLSQAGLPVPCSDCDIPLINKLCAVLNVSDELINKKSTHQMQMQSISYALKNLDEKSLLLMDEIGKNTCYRDGLGLSVSLIKYLVEERNIKSVFSTHFIEIKDYIEPLNNKIKFYKIINENSVKKVVEGTIEKSQGIEIAKKENLPDKIIDYAKNLAQNVL